MAVAGDDAHFHNGDLDAFGGYVMVKSETLEPESLLGALKAGEFYSSSGPAHLRRRGYPKRSAG